ncbi:MAG: sigma-70 family RNA polymerase sigma factor [Myxococcota bacterium]
MDATDEALLEAWKTGDNEAGTALFRRYFPMCRRFFVNKVPEPDVDDLLQRTFTALVESRAAYRGDSQFRSFLLGVARNILLKYLRTRSRRDAKHELDPQITSLADLGITPRTKIALARDEEAIRVALQRIPVHFQTVIELTYWEGLNSTELAAVLDVEPTTVRTRLHRARKALLKALEGTSLAKDRELEQAVEKLGRTL